VNSRYRNSKWFDGPFDRLTVLSKVEGLTTLSKVEGQFQMTKFQMFQTNYLVYSSGLFENWNINALDLFRVSDLGLRI